MKSSFQGLIPFYFTGGDFDYPQNGRFYINLVKTNNLSINKLDTEQYLDEFLSITDFYKYENEYMVKLRNNSDHDFARTRKTESWHFFI